MMPTLPRPQLRPTPPPALPPMRPSPQPPTTAVAAGTMSEPTPMPRFAPSLEEQETERAEPRTTRRPASRAPLFIAVAVLAAAIAAGIVWFALREKPATTTDRAASTTKDAGAPIGEKLDAETLAHTKQDCADFQRTELWKELKDCSDKIKPNEPALAAQYWKTADDEAANAMKWKGVVEHLKIGETGKARDLVKRIGENSVYTKRAHKALADAEATP
jgi:hypothetical protein